MPAPIEQHRSRRRRTTSPRPTMDDVAAAAGVSRTTVSRALSSDGQLVSSDTMAAIQRAVRQTGYVINQHARSLASQRSQAVAFVVCEPQPRLVDDSAFSVLLSVCAQILAVHRLGLSVLIAADPQQQARVCEQIASEQAAGALVISPGPDGQLVRELRAAEVPVVVYGSPAQRDPAVAQVAIDDRSGARQLVRYLHNRGRATIATIAGPADRPSGTDRLAGWRDLRGGSANDRLVAFGDYTCAGGRAAMAALLERVPAVDAVFVASDLMAAGAVTALRRAGRRIPDDVAVAGFGDSAVATSVEPALTTVRQPLSRAGTELVRLLRELIGGGPPTGVVLPTELVIRDST